MPFVRAEDGEKKEIKKVVDKGTEKKAALEKAAKDAQETLKSETDALTKAKETSPEDKNAIEALEKGVADAQANLNKAQAALEPSKLSRLYSGLKNSSGAIASGVLSAVTLEKVWTGLFGESVTKSLVNDYFSKDGYFKSLNNVTRLQTLQTITGLVVFITAVKIYKKLQEKNRDKLMKRKIFIIHMNNKDSLSFL